MGRREQDVLASLHEAGHAAVAVALGGRLEEVTMSQCRAQLSDPWSKVVYAVAGQKCARMFGPRWRSISRRLSPSDQEFAESAREEMGKPIVRGGWKRRAEEDARRIFARHYSGVHRVASALRKAGELDGRQVQRLLDGESVDDVLAEPARSGQEAPAGVPETDDLVATFYGQRDGTWVAFGGRDAMGVPIEAVGGTIDEAEDSLRALLAD